MLLSGCKTEIFRPECNPSFASVHRVAHLDEDIAPVLPYLNAALGGAQYLEDPPEAMFHHRGRIINAGGREIAVNALGDADEAERILRWLTEEINRTWEARDEITPRRHLPAKPKIIDILRFLPKTNCRKCGQPTCMVFAVRAAEGVVGAENRPELDDERRAELTAHLSEFEFD
ncbi:MAG: (Fe-S)-binding protein [Desulfococcaceae bacterium]